MDRTLVWRVARRWWWLLFVATLAGGALGYGVSLQLSPTYQATTTLLVTQNQAEGVVQLNDLQTAERLANTFSRLITLRPVLEQAITDGQLPFTAEDLEEALSVANPAGTQLLEVSARADNAEVAAVVERAWWPARFARRSSTRQSSWRPMSSRWGPAAPDGSTASCWGAWRRKCCAAAGARRS